MKITYWSDYACPYCYIGETRLKKAIAQVQEEEKIQEPVTLEMKAFRLDPSAGKEPVSDTVTRFAKKYRMSPMLAAHQIEKISVLGQREGLEFNYASTIFTNTADAHRLTKLAYKKRGSEAADKVSEALFKAYFANNKNLCDRDVLVNAGVLAGLEKNEIIKLLDSDDFADEVIEDENNAHAKGITGVPYFEINKEPLYGAETVSTFKRHLQNALKGSKSPDSDAEADGAHICGPEGCTI